MRQKLEKRTGGERGSQEEEDERGVQRTMENSKAGSGEKAGTTQPPQGRDGFLPSHNVIPWDSMNANQ